MAQQRAGEEGIAFIHLAASIGIDPPAATDITGVARTELGGQVRELHGGHEELLERTIRGQVGPNDGLEEQILAFDIDHDPDTITRAITLLGRRPAPGQGRRCRR